VLFACGGAAHAELDIEASAHPGPHAVELRAAKDAPAALVRAPLAAGRLLSRMHARGVAKSVAHAGAPKAVTVDETARATLDVTVPFGRCVEVALALGPGASGAEVRLVNSAGGEEIELGYGTESAAARACALAGPSLTARAELRVQSGATTALVTTRMLAPTQ